MSIIGAWTLTMNTPMGEQTGTLTLTGSDTQATGTMTGADGDTQPCADLKIQGDRVTWKMAVTKPIPLTLHFDVEVTGDSLSGKFRPGMFPPSPVTGVRA